MATRLIGLYSPLPQSGKSTVASHLVATHRFTRIGFADALKETGKALLRAAKFPEAHIEWHFNEGKDLVIPSPFGVTTRHLLQTLGTDWGRKLIKPSIWVEIAAAKVYRTDGPVVIDDVRFPDEADAIESMGGQVWRIHRPDSPVSTSHPSEGLLEGRKFAADISNSGTIGDLMGAVIGHLSA